MNIRPERPEDANAIGALVVRAFAAAAHSSGNEQFIVATLRKAGALTLSLVAEEAGQLRGQASFSPVSVTDGSRDWYGLGPVAVEPAVQGVGIGTALITSGLETLREAGAAGCVVLGEPGYYGRFGFIPVPTLVYPGAPPRYFLALPFGSSLPAGEVSYHASFTAGAA